MLVSLKLWLAAIAAQCTHCNAIGHTPAFCHITYLHSMLLLQLHICDSVPMTLATKLITIERKFDATLHSKTTKFSYKYYACGARELELELDASVFKAWNNN